MVASPTGSRRPRVCGIIGYVGSRAAKDLLLHGLERLEYRGYDSAGLALREDEGLEYVRAVGNLQYLKEAAGPNGSESSTGVGHTRWATHGRVCDENTHPLTGCEDSKIALVLNGIVENFREVKESLLAEGHSFSSETDAEVIAHLVERHYDGDIVAITPRGARIVHVEDGDVERETLEIDWDDEIAEKSGYETFMLKEI